MTLDVRNGSLIFPLAKSEIQDIVTKQKLKIFGMKGKKSKLQCGHKTTAAITIMCDLFRSILCLYLKKMVDMEDILK